MSDYLPPYGSADPNASYVDRNTGGGVPGSRVPGLAIEMPQREIKTVLLSVGMTPNKTDPTQLNAAIDAKIALATAGGENPLDDLLTLLRSRLPIFPEIKTADGRFNLSVPSTGTVRVPSGIVIQHRGVFPVTTIEQDFATSPNKVYHQRYRFTGTPGWALVDVSNSGYNPGGALAEDNVAFDTTLDDMITHRVVTDASNVATITPLVNKHDLAVQTLIAGVVEGSTGVNNTRFRVQSSFNWARTPTNHAVTLMRQDTDPGAANDFDYIVGAGGTDPSVSGAAYGVNRYRVDNAVLVDFGLVATFSFSARA